MYKVFLPKRPVTNIRSRFSADKLQIVRGEAEDTFVVCPHFGRKNKYDNNWQLF